MQPGITPILERHKTFHSRDREEACAFLDANGFRVELPSRCEAPVDMRVNCVRLSGLYVSYLQYGPAVTTHAKEPGTDYILTFPLRGRLEASVTGRAIACDVHHAVVHSYPPMPFDPIRSEEGCCRINVTISGAVLRRQLAALLGRQPHQPLVFSPGMALDQGYGRRLAWYLWLAIAEFDAADSAPWDARTATQFEQVVLTELLLSQPNTYSEPLRSIKPAAPRDIKRAIDYIEANLELPVTLADLVAASQVAGRTLFQHFRDFKGTSPMRYLREARFERVRRALLAAEPEENVTEIAANWGFTHLGRFAVEYRHRFGERPSDTLRRRRSAV